jgi:hypothetical protein
VFRKRAGVREGDPLSPALFALALEALPCVLLRSKTHGIRLTSFRILLLNRDLLILGLRGVPA